MTKCLWWPQTAGHIGLTLFRRWRLLSRFEGEQRRGVDSGEGGEQAGRRGFLTCSPVGWYMPRDRRLDDGCCLEQAAAIQALGAGAVVRGTGRPCGEVGVRIDGRWASWGAKLVERRERVAGWTRQMRDAQAPTHDDARSELTTRRCSQAFPRHQLSRIRPQQGNRLTTRMYASLLFAWEKAREGRQAPSWYCHTPPYYATPR